MRVAKEHDNLFRTLSNMIIEANKINPEFFLTSKMEYDYLFAQQVHYRTLQELKQTKYPRNSFVDYFHNQ